MSTALERLMLLDVRDVQRLCRVGRDDAYVLMHGAGVIRLGKGNALHVRPDDLDEHLRRLRDREAEE